MVIRLTIGLGALWRPRENHVHSGNASPLTRVTVIEKPEQRYLREDWVLGTDLWNIVYETAFHKRIVPRIRVAVNPPLSPFRSGVARSAARPVRQT